MNGNTCINENTCINALVTAVRNDISRGLEEGEIIKALSNVVSREIVAKVKAQL